jgi:spermidine/putrescine transport system permease protein
MMKSKAAAAPFTVWMLLFTVIPLGIVLWFAFTNEEGQFTLSNLLYIWDYAATFGVSIFYGAIATILCLILAFPLAYNISRATERVQQTMVMIIMLPMWMNFLLRTYAWMSILENNGFINQLLRLIGVLPDGGSVSLINTGGAIVLGMVYNFLPFMVLPLYSVMAKIDNSVIEAAQDLGSNVWQVFGKVVIPLSIPGMLSGITMVFVPAVSTFVITKLLGGSKTLMIGDAIETMFIGQGANYHVGATLSLVLMLLILVCMAVTGMADKGEEEQV